MFNRRIIFGSAVVVIMAGLVSIVEAVPTVPIGQSIYNTTQNLSIASPNFFTDFQATETAGLAELWAVAGSTNTAGEAYVNWQFGAGNLKLGDTNFQHGTIFYKFSTTDMFNGGTVTNSANYQGGFAHMFVATTAVAPTSSNGWNGFDPLVTTAGQKKFYDQFWGEGTYTVNIPVGVQEFWVVISKPDGGSSNNAFERSLDVQATVVPVPEPATMILLSIGAVGFLRRKK